MKNLLLLFLFILSPLVSEFSGKVVKIADGDTITVLVDEEQIRVRLTGIDCPEKSQDFGQVARQFTADHCFSKTVTVIDHGKDRYGRTLGDVKLPDGKLLSYELVRVGLAWHYKRYSSDTTLARLEIEARERKVGLWSDTHAIAPWEYRRQKK